MAERDLRFRRVEPYDFEQNPARAAEIINSKPNRVESEASSAIATGTATLAANTNVFTVSNSLVRNSDDVYVGVQQQDGGPRINQVVKMEGQFRVVVSSSRGAARTFSWVVIDRTRATLTTPSASGPKRLWPSGTAASTGQQIVNSVSNPDSLTLKESMDNFDVLEFVMRQGNGGVETWGTFQVATNDITTAWADGTRMHYTDVLTSSLWVRRGANNTTIQASGFPAGSNRPYLFYIVGIKYA